MPIRIAGINSGMDTDAMVKELMKASSVKKDNLIKDQTRLKWKQDAWKSLNNKVYNFFNKYTENMKYTSAYNKKITKVANSDIANVTAGDIAVNGSQTLSVKQLSKSAYMTGGKIEAGFQVSGSTTMRDMGIASGSETAKIAVTVDGRETEIEINGDMTMDQLMKQMDGAGISVNFDAKNQRIFVSAKKSGAAGNFDITSKDASGARALSFLGLTANPVNDAETSEWASMKPNAGATADDIKQGQMFQDKVRVEKDRIIGLIEQSKLNVETKLSDLQRTNAYIQAQTSPGNTDAEKLQNLEQYYIDNESTMTDAQKQETKDKITALQESVQLRDAIDQHNDLLTDENKASIKANVENEYVAKVNAAYSAMQTPTGDRVPVKVDGQDAKIVLNGAEFSSDSNTFNINGLTITAQAVSEKDAAGNSIETTINTADDVEGIYNLIKDFLKEYNSLMKEMDTLYKAKTEKDFQSAKKYQPLTKEEKEIMSDKEIEDWENKIKDSILQRDNSLGKISNVMKMAMMEGVQIDGKRVSLSDYGIELPSYFKAGDNEKNLYHIAGDKDDPTSSGETDKLRAAIASDPDTLKKFFTQFSQNMYDAINQEMRSVQNSRSVYHVYDDKKMETDYRNYDTEIRKQEKRLLQLENKYYAQFAAMEKAMSQLNSQQSALSSLLAQ